MTLDKLCDLCEALSGTEKDFPFDDEILAFRVGGKIYALVNITEHPPRVNLKCDPEYAIELREEYEGVRPGYHMNKKHWNTVHLAEDVPSKLMGELVRHSYQLVFDKLPAAVREGLANE